MLKPENSIVVDQHQQPALGLIAARPELFARQGSVVASFRRRNGKTFGPYYRLAYRAAGRQASVYLGRAGALVEAVRHKLAELQKHIQEHRTFERIRRGVLASIRVHKVRIRGLLYPFGLRLKGMEVRGWRTSVFRNMILRRRFPRRLPSLPRPAALGQSSPASRLLNFLQRRDGYVPPNPQPLPASLAAYGANVTGLG